MIRKSTILLLCLLGVIESHAQIPSWSSFIQSFVTDFKALEIDPIRLSYVQNLENVQSIPSIQKQIALLETTTKKLDSYSRDALNPKEQLEYDLLVYHLELHTERANWELKWQGMARENIPDGGLREVAEGKTWYLHFLRRWIDLTVKPDSLYAFGVKEVEKVLGNIHRIQQKSGLDSSAFLAHIESPVFYYNDPTAVQKAFETLDQRLATLLPDFFPEINLIIPVKIARGTDKRLAQVPAFYRNNTFFYNFFGDTFNKRQVVWFYLHEAMPGHHYEISYSRQIHKSPLQGLSNNPCYSEGWAAYIEEIGTEIGAYQTIYDELGKWEWDLIRSVRVPMDIGLNYYQWSDEEALAFWKKYIPNKDDIGQREIDRMKRWPCQVITYKYGADKILKWKKKAEESPNFNLLDFHTQILENGPMPFSILEHLLS